jgi:hypothetical protein
MIGCSAATVARYRRTLDAQDLLNDEPQWLSERIGRLVQALCLTL